jgi:hypothetical protein
MTSSANAQAAFTLSSTTFKDGTMMPKKVANKNLQNSNCVGDNVSPELSWSGTPAGTKSPQRTERVPLGRLWKPTNMSEVKARRGGLLFRPVHPARLAAPLHLQDHRDRSRRQGTAAA